jgi:hypothetical protein
MMTEEKREYMRQYRAAHPDRMVNYARRSQANSRARHYGVPGELSMDDIEVIMSAGRCFYCGSTKKLGLDHVKPMHAGGPNIRENVVCCCHPCNQSKGRADRPGRWSQLYDFCQRCGTGERSHWVKGLCRPCHRAIHRTPRKRRSDVAPPNLSCERCGTGFHLKPSAVRKGRGRYCSTDCRRYQDSAGPVESRAVVGRAS